MKNRPNIIHILADGTKVKDITGHVIPKENPVYQVIFENRGKT